MSRKRKRKKKEPNRVRAKGHTFANRAARITVRKCYGINIKWLIGEFIDY